MNIRDIRNNASTSPENYYLNLVRKIDKFLQQFFLLLRSRYRASIFFFLFFFLTTLTRNQTRKFSQQQLKIIRVRESKVATIESGRRGNGLESESDEVVATLHSQNPFATISSVLFVQHPNKFRIAWRNGAEFPAGYNRGHES